MVITLLSGQGCDGEGEGHLHGGRAGGRDSVQEGRDFCGGPDRNGTLVSYSTVLYRGPGIHL